MEGSGSAPPVAVRVFLNPYAGGENPTSPEDLARSLEREGVAADVEVVRPEDLARRIAEEIPGRRLIAVAGGDGSHATAAAALLDSETALAPIPTGRLNHFARRAGLDSVATAAAAIREGHRRTVSVGRSADDVFLDTAVIGGYRDFVRVRERLRPRLTTWPAAAVSALLVLLRWPRVPVSVRVPGAELGVRTAFLWVGVGRDSFPEPHEAPLAMEEDALQLVILPGGRLAGARFAAGLLRYPVRGDRALERGPADVSHPDWIEIHSAHPIPVVLDGEPRFMDPPVRLELAPMALQLMVPPV